MFALPLGIAAVVMLFTAPYAWLNCMHSLFLGDTDAGKTWLVINILLHKYSPFLAYYEKVVIISDKCADPHGNRLFDTLPALAVGINWVGPVRQKNRLFDTLSALAVEITLGSKDRQAWDCPDNNRNGPYRQKNGLSGSLSTHACLCCARNVGCCSHVP